MPPVHAFDVEQEAQVVKETEAGWPVWVYLPPSASVRVPFAILTEERFLLLPAGCLLPMFCAGDVVLRKGTASSGNIGIILFLFCPSLTFIIIG